MTKYTWRNIVAFPVWKCKLCGHLSDRDNIASHLHDEHGIQSVEMGRDVAYSINYNYPEVEK